jgi:3-(3-hydroxy-phenyl)propionate hydroxylase
VAPLVVVPARGAAAPAGVRVIEDVQGLVRQRYDGRPGSVYLLRPDQHVAARWRALDAARVRQALARATCNA